MRLVVLGSQGFIFSHVVEYFLEKGWEVIGIDNLSAGSHPELVNEFEKSPKFRFFEKDVSHLPIVDFVAGLNPDYIIHAAAISDVDYSIKNPTKTLQANNNATINAFEAARRCRNLKRFLYVSTDEVYGECENPKAEDAILFPRNPYALSKAFGSIMRLAYDNTYPELKDKTCETRFCNVFGPRQDTRKIIPSIMRSLDGGAPVALHNDGAGFRQWIYVKDIPPIIELLLERGHRTYNITADMGSTVKDLINFAQHHLGRTIRTVPGKRSGMDMKYMMDGTRFRKEFGWVPKYMPDDAFIQLLKGTPL